MLPKLRENRVKRGDAGKWNRQSSTAFDDVARSIDVVVTTDIASVNSIPSMWAHPLALQSVLSSNDYHERIRLPLINQWRSMLVAIALAPDFTELGKLTAKYIDLTNTAYQNNKFIQSLRRLVPNSHDCLFTLDDNLNPWLQSYIFCWNGKSIGMTSPTTIVCPAEDADWSGLPWFVNGQLLSPARYLDQDQKQRLCRWLVYVRRYISAKGLGIHNQISTLINEFINDLGGDLNESLEPQQDFLADQTYYSILIELDFYATILQPLRNQRDSTVFFLPSDKLYFFRSPNAFPNIEIPDSLKNLSYSGLPISLILPIDPEFFNREDASLLIKTLKVESLKANTILKFSIQIDGYEITKQYELSDDNVISGLPIAEIWPNFISSNWQIYYAYSYDLDQSGLSFHFPSIPSLVHEFGVSKLSKLDKFPQYITCSLHGQIVGTLPLKIPEVITNSNNDWTVGVDFGTSFTNAYKKQGNVDEKISFDNLHYAITMADPIAKTSALIENFIPLQQNLPIASLLSTKDYRNSIQVSDDLDIIFDARIYAPETVNKIVSGRNFLIGNLKWDKLKNQEPMRLFIEQLALQISAQAVKNGVNQIQWLLSYPTAFSRRDKNSYVTIWNDCSSKLSQVTGIVYSDDLRANNKRHFRSESLAVAHYFGSKKKKSLLNAACVDIGGGTSDISIWEEHDNQIVPVYQCSIQFAGKQLFSNIIRRNPTFLTHLKLTSREDNLVNLEQDPALFISAIDTLVKERGQDWLKNQRRKFQDDDKLYGYLRILSIGIAGLHYYIGLVLQVLHQKKSSGSQRYRAGVPVDIYFGGNGCRLLNWLSDTGKFDGDEIGELFQEMIIKASKFKSLGEQNTVSDSPKEEAACGLVVGRMQLGEPSNEEDLVAGEPCRIGSRVFNWDSYISFDPEIAENITSLQVVKSAEELVNLPQFLYWYHKGLRRRRDIGIPPIQGYSLGDPQKEDRDNLETTVEDNARLFNQIVKKLRDSLVLEEDATTDSIRIEPPFILALKALLEVLTDEWARQ
jgi:hypothetical protein